MIENSEIIAKLIVTLLLAYISIKFMAPLVQLLWDKIFNSTQKSNVSLDMLIEREKQLLRNGLTKPESSPSQNKSSPNKTLDAYQSYLQKLTSDKNKNQKSIDDVKKIFSLFDNLQWGEGPTFEHIRKEIKEEFNISVNQSKITAILKKFIENNFLMSRKSSVLPNYKEVIDILELATIANELINESTSKEYLLLESLSLRWKISCLDIAKGLLLLMQPRSNSQTTIQKDILNGKIKIHGTYENKLFGIIKSDDNKFFQSKKDFLKKLNSSSIFFSILSPLDAPEDKNDLQRAKKIFYAHENTSLEDIKKTYKKMVAMKHPDKLPSHGIPTEFESIATKNFSIIQQSYDIILNKYENK